VGPALGVARFLRRRSLPFPPDTDPARLKAATRAVRRGELTGDPETDALALRLAGEIGQSPYRPRLTVAVLGALVLLQLAALASALHAGETGRGVLHAALAVLVATPLAALPQEARRRRAAARLPEPFERAAEPWPDGRARSGPDPAGR
ncbi:hypothetical protein, partial [Streptomyces otsuchiensis]|uniref:hypothetical protein n=1 Tax=Streptomyces otsuchiensis TaxID=2681388 RepID=UPI001D13239E